MSKKLFYILLATISISLLASCSSTKKLKTNVRQKTETTLKVEEAATQVTAAEITTVEETDSSYADTETISITFEEPGSEDGELITDDTTKPKEYTYEIDGKTIVVPKPIKKIEIENKKTGETRVVETTQAKTTDSSSTSKKIDSTAHTDTIIKDKQVTRSGPRWWQISLIALLLVVIMVCYYLWQKTSHMWPYPFSILAKDKDPDG